MQLNADGYGSHTSPTHHTVRTPLVPRDLGEDFSLDFEDEPALDPRKPKNAKYVIKIIYLMINITSIWRNEKLQINSEKYCKFHLLFLFLQKCPT